MNLGDTLRQIVEVTEWPIQYVNFHGKTKDEIIETLKDFASKGIRIIGAYSLTPDVVRELRTDGVHIEVGERVNVISWL